MPGTSTGTLESTLTPLASMPQHATFPLARIAQVASYPALITAAPVNPLTIVTTEPPKWLAHRHRAARAGRTPSIVLHRLLAAHKYGWHPQRWKSHP